MTHHRYLLFIGLAFVLAGMMAALFRLAPLGLIQALVIAAVFLAAALFFAHYFIRDDSRWWALLPAGLFFTLAVMRLLDGLAWIRPELQSVVFCSGVSLTLYCLWHTHRTRIQFVWARFLAFITAVAAVTLFTLTTGWIDTRVIVAVGLLAAGIWLLLRRR